MLIKQKSGISNNSYFIDEKTEIGLNTDTVLEAYSGIISYTLHT